MQRQAHFYSTPCPLKGNRKTLIVDQNLIRSSGVKMDSGLPKDVWSGMALKTSKVMWLSLSQLTFCSINITNSNTIFWQTNKSFQQTSKHTQMQIYTHMQPYMYMWSMKNMHNVKEGQVEELVYTHSPFLSPGIAVCIYSICFSWKRPTLSAETSCNHLLCLVHSCTLYILYTLFFTQKIKDNITVNFHGPWKQFGCNT